MESEVEDMWKRVQIRRRVEMRKRVQIRVFMPEPPDNELPKEQSLHWIVWKMVYYL